MKWFSAVNTLGYTKSQAFFSPFKDVANSDAFFVGVGQVDDQSE
jgi:hypothetical protein